MSNLDKATFIEKAQEICRESFWAYFVENDMSKSCAHMPVDRFKSFCIDKLHTQVNYEQFMDYLMPTDCYKTNAIVENVKLQVPFATQELCVVFLTANIKFPIDNGYILQHSARISYVVAQREGQQEILHLHFSMPHKSPRNVHLHGIALDNFAKMPLNNLDKGAAMAAGMYSPNGLIFYQISGKEQINLANDSLLKLLGYAGNKELQSHTQGQLEKLVAPEDWSRVQKQLTKRIPGTVFNMNATFLRKDGSRVKVLFRGNYVETHNKFFILSLTPLLVPVEELSYGDFSEEDKSAENYSISYELFLKIALDIFVQYGREKGIPYLLELTTAVLNAHNGSICDIRNYDAPMLLMRNYTTPGYKKIVPITMPAKCILYWSHKHSTNYYDSLENMPEPIRSICIAKGVCSLMYQFVKIDGKESFVLHFLRQENKPWTENEKRILHYATKIFSLVLDAYSKTNPEQSITSGGGGL